MGNLNSGQLTLLAFGVLALFGVLAFLSLRRNIRGIRPATPEELEAMEHPGTPVTDSPSVETSEVNSLEEGIPGSDLGSDAPSGRRSRRGRRPPKASTRS